MRRWLAYNYGMGKKPKRTKLVSVYHANGEAEAYIIRDILAENGLPCVLSSDVPSGIIGTGIVMVSVLVDETKAEEARELLREQDDV